MYEIHNTVSDKYACAKVAFCTRLSCIYRKLQIRVCQMINKPLLEDFITTFDNYVSHLSGEI